MFIQNHAHIYHCCNFQSSLAVLGHQRGCSPGKDSTEPLKLWGLLPVDTRPAGGLAPLLA